MFGAKNISLIVNGCAVSEVVSTYIKDKTV